MASAFTGSRNRLGSHQALARPGDVRGGLFRWPVLFYRDLLRELWPAGRYTRSRVQLISARVPVNVSTELGVPWALTSIGRRQALPPSCLALFLDGDHFGRLRPARGHRAREVEAVAVTADAKNHSRMLWGHRRWLRALPRVWKRSEFRWHSDTTIPLLGVQKPPKQTRTRAAEPQPCKHCS